MNESKNRKVEVLIGTDDNHMIDLVSNCIKSAIKEEGRISVNTDQENFDGDDLGDVCDLDDDNDKVMDENDDCPLTESSMIRGRFE